ncbi:MAG: type II secretion system protein GspD, partial [Phycisphaerales bacterium JB041]
SLNEGRSLSIPKVLVASNEQASLNSVLEQPYTTLNASDTVATTSFGGSSDAGTEVSVRPQIAEGDHLRLEYQISLSAFVGDAADPSIPPPRQQNSIDSVATIPDGYTIAVGGIELTTEGYAETGIPLLSDIPLLGEAFKNRSKSGSRSRFYVFIRSTILRDRSFEDLKYLSDLRTSEVGIDDGWPEPEPRVIR